MSDEAKPVRPAAVRRPPMPEGARRPAQAQEQAPEPSRAEGTRVEHAGGGATPAPFPEAFEAREGDALVVSVPEITLPLPAKFATMKLGGFIYTRRLREGEDVGEQAKLVADWLERFSERIGRERFRKWAAEFGGGQARRRDDEG